jgi:23S rRNA (cytosine1962-C5)-methyltransferase
MFANRLEKVFKHTGKWARKQGISCFRVYDNDMPEFPLAIDLYENIVHVSEYERMHGMEPQEHVAWLEGCLEVISKVLGITKDLIYLKFRQRQKGLSQYDRFSRTGAEYIVRENGLSFIINPSDYLDTGLFLDHRNTRQMVRNASEGKKVLNLFAYTGSFTVYAAAGGARESLTLDMSNTYLQWADRNLTLNKLSQPQHKLMQADVLEWLRESPIEPFDLIVLDPPTFSNSKRMNGTLDIQRDHIWLINRAIDRLSSKGMLFFSTNFRKFKMDTSEIKRADIQNISAKTVPNDFRNQKIHHSFLIQK